MSEQTDQLRKLFEQGATLLATAKYPPSELLDEFSPEFVDDTQMTVWRTRVRSFTRALNLADDTYVSALEEHLRYDKAQSVEAALALLEALAEDIDTGTLAVPSSSYVVPLVHIEKIFDRFHIMVRQMLNRHDNRDTLKINDEYDVQDIPSVVGVLQSHALLDTRSRGQHAHSHRSAKGSSQHFGRLADVPVQ